MRKPAASVARLRDEKAPQAIEAKPGNIQEMAKQIVKTLGHKEAEKLAMAIADLVIDAGMDQPCRNRLTRDTQPREWPAIVRAFLLPRLF